MIDKLTGIDISACLYGDNLLDAPTALAECNGLQSAILPTQDTVAGVANIILVSSAKGGVGKSSMTIAFSQELANMGAKVGILDADIYGPSIPLMLGEDSRATLVDNKIMPVEVKGLSILSIASLAGMDQDIIWRGPRASGMLKEMLIKTAWQNLDYLVIDMPPGTGDIQLTLAQSAPVAGAIVVTTPHKVAITDANKGISMFTKLNIPILGVIENMAYYHCTQCSHKQEFSEDHSALLSAPILGSIPMLPELGMMLDAGQGAQLNIDSFKQTVQKIVIGALVSLSEHNNQPAVEIEN